MKSTLAEKLLFIPCTLVRATKCTCMHVDLCCRYYMSMTIQTKHRLDTEKYKSSSYYKHFVSILI